jgi:hypothetical protein
LEKERLILFHVVWVKYTGTKYSLTRGKRIKDFDWESMDESEERREFPGE